MDEDERLWWVFERARRVAARVLKWKHRDAIDDVAQDTVVKIQEREDSEVTHGLVAKIAGPTALKLAAREPKRPRHNSEHSERLAKGEDPETWEAVKQLIHLIDEVPPEAMTPLHVRVVQMSRSGLSNKDIATELNLDPRRVSKTKREAFAILRAAMRN